MEGSLIDLLDDPAKSESSGLNLSLSGHVPAAGMPVPAEGQGAKTADTSGQGADPFAGFAALVPQHGTGTTEVEQQPAPAQQDTPQEPQQPSPANPAVVASTDSNDSCAASLQAAAERAARTSDVLQQHSVEQGESNAKLRLLLATVAAKQVKARKMLAELSSDFSSALTDSQSSSLQQVQDLTDRLQQAHQQVSAAQADAEQQRKLAAQHADTVMQRHSQLQQLQAELKALRKSESRARNELRDRESRLLEAQAALSRLSAELPGSRRMTTATLDSMSDDGSNAAGSSALSPGGTGADADTADSGSGALPLTPVGSAAKKGSRRGQGTGGGVGGSGALLNVMTPDQAAAAQYKEWLSASQQALIEAQDELMAREAEVKQLKQQLQQRGSASGQEEQQHAGGDQRQQPGIDSLLAQEQEQQLQQLQAAADAAAAAAAAAGAQRDQLSTELDGLRSELMQLKLQLEAADCERTQAVAALEALQQQQQQQQDTEPQHQQQASEAAVEPAAAAEAQLQKALAAAAEAAAEISALQQQQEQQQQQECQPGSPSTAAGSSDAAAASKPAAGHNTTDLDLLQAHSRIQVLRDELHDTQDSMRLLLQLVRKCAAAAAGAALTGGSCSNGGSMQTALATAAAGALTPGEQQQMQQMLQSAAVVDCPDAVSTAGSDSDAAAAGAARFELGVLQGLLYKLESRYCTPKPLQEVVLRGKEMELLLSTALAHAHAIKARAGGGPCECPTENDYLHPIKAAPVAVAPAAAVGGVLHEQQAAAAVGPAVHVGGQQAQAQLRPFAVIDTAAAAAPGGDGYFSEVMHSGNGWATGDGYGAVSESSTSFGGYSSHANSAAGGWESWGGGGAVSSGGAAPISGSCGGDALRGCGGNSGPGAAAASSSSFGGAAAAGGVGGLAPLKDEGMGYDGLEGSWWAQSSVEPVTELPDFLIKKD